MMIFSLDGPAPTFRHRYNALGHCKGYLLDWIVFQVQRGPITGGELSGDWRLKIASTRTEADNGFALLRAFEDLWQIPRSVREEQQSGSPEHHIVFPGSVWMRSPTLLSGLVLIIRTGGEDTITTLPRLERAEAACSLNLYYWSQCKKIGRFKRLMTAQGWQTLAHMPWDKCTGSHSVGFGTDYGEEGYSAQNPL